MLKEREGRQVKSFYFTVTLFIWHWYYPAALKKTLGDICVCYVT